MFLSFPINQPNLKSVERLIAAIRRKDDFKYGDEKSGRAYVRKQGNITKPSYIGRMRDYDFFRPQSNNVEPIDQIELILENFERTPQASNFSVAIFHPTDLRDQFRPGYVPCLSLIDIKYRHGSLATKFLFRSCNLGEVGIYDLFHCMKLHAELSSEMKARRPDLSFDNERALIFFSRAFAYKRYFSQVSDISREIDDYCVA